MKPVIYLLLVAFLLVGCSEQDDTKDQIIAQLQDQLARSEAKQEIISELRSEIATLQESLDEKDEQLALLKEQIENIPTKQLVKIYFTHEENKEVEIIAKADDEIIFERVMDAVPFGLATQKVRSINIELAREFTLEVEEKQSGHKKIMKIDLSEGSFVIVDYSSQSQTFDIRQVDHEVAFI